MTVLPCALFTGPVLVQADRLCGLVVRVPGCYLRGPGFDSHLYQIFYVGLCLERSSLSLIRINEFLLERKVAALV
jgi:hypothetical protein